MQTSASNHVNSAAPAEVNELCSLELVFSTECTIGMVEGDLK